MSNNVRRHRIASVAVGAAIIVGLGSVGAVADGLIGSADIKDDSIAKRDIGSRAVGGSEIKLDSVKKKHLAPKLREQINQMPLQGEPGPAGPQGPAGPAGSGGGGGTADLLGALVAHDGYEGPRSELETAVGGGPVGQAVELGSLQLPAGTHLLSANVIAETGPMGMIGSGLMFLSEAGAPIGGDVNIFPISNAQQVVSVPLGTTMTIRVLGVLPTPEIEGSEADDYHVWFKASAIRVSSEYVDELAADPIFPGWGAPAFARQLQRAAQ
jgi:hypothetical protein